MSEARRYVAFDLGAESGRAVVGSLAGEKLELEVMHRFPNGPVRVNDTLHWDAIRIHAELKQGLAAASAQYGESLASIGTDSWGVDFGLLDRTGALLGNPVHYRDARTNGMPEALFKIMPKKKVFQHTGIQIMQINTLYQLFSLVKGRSQLLEIAETMLPMADLQNYFLTGEKAAEFTLATTTQAYDPNASDWSYEILTPCGIPRRIMPEVVAPGSIVGQLYDHIAEECGLRPIPVVAPACHDTAAAVAAAPAEGDDWLFLSSGTWSLLGAELDAPLINDRTYQLNFTNEGGVDGTFRFLKNIMGLWLVQECKRQWAREGEDIDYGELVKLADAAPAFRGVIDPNSEDFLAPGGMPERIAAYLSRTGQTVPESKGGFVRVALESLALCYRHAVEAIQEVTDKTYRVIHVVGGGSQNRLLNQFLADATGLVVKSGPVEATAFGNCLMQAVALGDIGSLAEARRIVRASAMVETFDPSSDRGAWEEAYGRYRDLTA